MKIFIGGSSIYSAKKLKLPYKKIYDYVKEGSSKDHKKNHELNVLALTETKNSTHMGATHSRVLEGTKQLFAVASNLRRYVFIDDLLYFGADDPNDDNVD